MQPAVNGTDERLDAILVELRGLRRDLQPKPVPEVDPAASVELREPVEQPQTVQPSAPHRKGRRP